MIGIILCGSLETKLEQEIASLDPDHELGPLAGVPRALLPINGVSILDRWLHILREKQSVSEIFLVSNGLRYKYFERWATGHGLGVDHVVNNGCTRASASLGAVNDLRLGLERAKFLGSYACATASSSSSVKEAVGGRDVLVVGADHLFHCGFSLDGFLRFYNSRRTQRPDMSFCFCYKTQIEDTSSLGIVATNASDQSAIHFWEKPCSALDLQAVQESSESTITACPCFYILRASAVAHIYEFAGMQQMTQHRRSSMGHLMEYLINPVAGSPESRRHGFFVMRLPSGYRLIGGSIDLSQYQLLDERFRDWERDKLTAQPSHELGTVGRNGGTAGREFIEVIKVKSYARVGLLGNPSDGFNGRTIAATVSNYFAEITIFESKELRLLPHPLYDPHSFTSLGALFEIGHREGYQGGLRLLMATCKKFFEYCCDQGVSLPKRNFTVKYDTNIPRQVGLAGSSAIVSAFVKALMEFFCLDNSDIKQALQPNLILNVEVDELHINAGLQDRVVQVYGGVVCMDFAKDLMERDGHGEYERLDLELSSLPPLWLAFVADPSDSGRMHSNIRQRWLDNDPAVLDGMRKFADYTLQGKVALLAGKYEEFMDLMSKNFDLRKELYGEDALGSANLQMIKIARDAGSACKFPGSGGAIVGMCKEETLVELRRAFESQGFVFVQLFPFAPTDEERVTRLKVRAAALSNTHTAKKHVPRATPVKSQ